MKKNSPAFALLAGGGALPAIMCAAASAKGWPVHLITFTGQPEPTPMPEAQSTKQFALGQVGHILAHLRGLGITHAAMAGHINKPKLFDLKPDAAGLKLLARAVIMHDDALLRAVTTTLAENGMEVVSVADLAPGLLAPAGLLTKASPTPEEKEDIALARSTLAVLGDLDIGQACIVYKGTILGVEAAEGTDELIQRCASLRGTDDRGGILVKRAKPLQTELADLPAVGPKTLELLTAHHYRGLAVQAGKTLLLSQPELIASANTHALFIASDS